MSIHLAPLPAIPHPGFDSLLAELPPTAVPAFKVAEPTLGTLLQSAPYLLELARTHADWLADALERGPDVVFAELLTSVAEAATTADEASLGQTLRLAKGRTALLAAVAETGGVWTTAKATEALSDLADAALEAALDFLMAQAFDKGQLLLPREEARAKNSGLALFALGKHGGRELNYSSDIDIVAFFDPQKPVLVDPSEGTKIYSRMVQKLVGLMEDHQAHGYVFRTDLRLRPDPGSTPVALSVDAALAYYEVRGQNWERAAWIKARPCAGDKLVGEAFVKELAPYVWRKHLDFATIADIQAMKRQINVSKNVGDIRVEGHNVKLGRGGIREIEFFAQTQQLIAGGRDKALRVRPTSQALAALAAANWISPTTASSSNGNARVSSGNIKPKDPNVRRTAQRNIVPMRSSRPANNPSSPRNRTTPVKPPQARPSLTRIATQTPAVMATAAKLTIVECDKLVDNGAIDPDDVHLPGIFVHRIVHVPEHENAFEYRTVRKR